MRHSALAIATISIVTLAFRVSAQPDPNREFTAVLPLTVFAVPDISPGAGLTYRMIETNGTTQLSTQTLQMGVAQEQAFKAAKQQLDAVVAAEQVQVPTRKYIE